MKVRPSSSSCCELKWFLTTRKLLSAAAKSEMIRTDCGYTLTYCLMIAFAFRYFTSSQ